MRAFGLFLFAVYDQWAVLVTGCLLLSLAGIVERTIRGKIRLPWYYVVLAALLLFAIFRAWDTEYERVRSLEGQRADLNTEVGKLRAIVSEKNKRLEELGFNVVGKLADVLVRPNNTGPKNAITNAPGGVIAAGPVTFQTAPLLIQSITLMLSVEEMPGPPSPSVGKSLGPFSYVSFSSRSGAWYRFMSDGVVSETLTPGGVSIQIRYGPDVPDQLLGKSVEMLETFTALVIDFGGLPGMTEFRQRACTLNVELRANGVTVLSKAETFPDCWALVARHTLNVETDIRKGIAKYSAMSSN